MSQDRKSKVRPQSMTYKVRQRPGEWKKLGNGWFSGVVRWTFLLRYYAGQFALVVLGLLAVAAVLRVIA